MEDHLIDHMWHDLLPQKPALLALMEMFDLLCPRLDVEEVRVYYVIFKTYNREQVQNFTQLYKNVEILEFRDYI